MTTRSLAAALAVATSAVLPLQAAAQSEPFIGQIMCAGYNFTPRGWAPLDGQLLPIAQNQALFALLGTTYGGDGRTTFGLPDMRGRALVHVGSGPGLTPRSLGERGGAETHTLNASQMPAHTHSVAPRASTAAPSASSPTGNVPGTRPRLKSYAAGPGDTEMAPAISSAAGGNQPVPQMPPYVTVNCYIALVGIFPSRD